MHKAVAVSHSEPERHRAEPALAPFYERTGARPRPEHRPVQREDRTMATLPQRATSSSASRRRKLGSSWSRSRLPVIDQKAALSAEARVLACSRANNRPAVSRCATSPRCKQNGRVQPPPPANHAARSTAECGSPCGATGGGFVAVPVTLVGATPTRTTTQSPSRWLAIQLAPGSASRLRSTSAIASSRVIGSGYPHGAPPARCEIQHSG